MSKQGRLNKTALASLSVLLAAPGVDAAPQAETGAASPPPRGSAEPADSLEDVLVVGRRFEFFRPTAQSSATKIPLPLVDTPQSVSVLTADILNLTAADNLEDTVGLTPGFKYTGTYGGFDNRFSARGFDIEIDEGILVNGTTSASNVDRDFLGVERVEFLRGPSSITLGVLNYGGAINLITRRPSAERNLSARVQLGTFDTENSDPTYRVEAEWTGPLNESASVRGYFGIAYDDRNDFKDAVESQVIPVRAALDADLGASTVLRVDFAYDDGDGVPAGTFAAFRGPGGGFVEPTAIPRAYAACALADGCFSEWQTLNTTVQLRHEFHPSLYALGTVSYATTDRQHQFISFLGFPIAADGSGAFWYTYNDTDEFETVFAELAVGGKFEAFGRDNDFIVAVERKQRNYVQDYRLQDDALFGQRTNILTNTPAIFVQPTFSWNTDDNETTNTSISAQVVLRPFERVTALVGARWEEEEIVPFGQRGIGTDGVPNSLITREATVDDIVLRGGLVFELTEGLNLYASYSQGFIPQSSFDDDGNLIDPESGEQFEVGLKGEYLDGRIGFALTAFEIERRVPAFVLDTTVSPPRSVQQDTNTQKHQGFEFELLGEPFRGLDVIATYSYLDAKFTGSTRTGLSVPAAPEHAGALFLQYEMPAGILQGLSFGAGVRHTGAVFGDSNERLTLRDYTLLEANVAYDFSDKVRVQLTGKNLTDEVYFTNFLDQFGLAFCCMSYGQPREFVAAMNVRF